MTGSRPDAAQARAALAMVSAETLGKQVAAEKSLIALGKLESFSQKVAPILAKRCLACHDAKTAKGRFNVETFASLMRGGESGAEIMPGKSADSNLVNLIEDGTMPQDADPLSKDEIAVIRKWIDTGATLDAGLNPADPLIAIMPSLPQPLPPVAYRVPIPVTAIAYSPDGSQLATSGYHEILIWSGKDGRRLGSDHQHRRARLRHPIQPGREIHRGRSRDAGAAWRSEAVFGGNARADGRPGPHGRRGVCRRLQSGRQATGDGRGRSGDSRLRRGNQETAASHRGSCRLGDGRRLAARRIEARSPPAATKRPKSSTPRRATRSSRSTVTPSRSSASPRLPTAKRSSRADATRACGDGTSRMRRKCSGSRGSGTRCSAWW